MMRRGGDVHEQVTECSVCSHQGLDVLEIMRNIHVFVSRYLYNLNNQVTSLFSPFYRGPASCSCFCIV